MRLVDDGINLAQNRKSADFPRMSGYMLDQHQPHFSAVLVWLDYVILYLPTLNRELPLVNSQSKSVAVSACHIPYMIKLL